jgi:hypothetical protein
MAAQIDLKPKNRYNLYVWYTIRYIVSLALKRYKTCHAIYWQKARIKSEDIDGSDHLTAGFVLTELARPAILQPAVYAKGLKRPSMLPHCTKHQFEKFNFGNDCRPNLSVFCQLTDR